MKKAIGLVVKTDKTIMLKANMQGSLRHEEQQCKPAMLKT